MKCYNVKCIDENGNEYNVGCMTKSNEYAGECAMKSMFEGRHLKVKVVEITEVDAI